MCTRRIAWPANMRIKSCWSMSFAARVSRSMFLNRALGQSPEDDLLLQVQGMIAEYERAKIIERHRRGKRHAAQIGAVNVLSGAPYGYRYVTKYEGGGQARYEIIPDEARVVRQVFAWVGQRPPDDWGSLSPADPGRRGDPHGQDRVGSECRVGHLEESGLSRRSGVWQDTPGAAAPPAAGPAQPARAAAPGRLRP